jgi:hypothetical protein
VDVMGLQGEGAAQLIKRQCNPLEIHLAPIKNPGDCPDTITILIGGAMDSTTQAARGSVPYNVYAEWDQDRQVRRFIIDIHQQCPKTRIALIGDSYGGDTARLVTRALDVPIEYLITLDPVSRFNTGSTKNTKPANVTNWINIYSTQAPFSSWNNFIAFLGGRWGNVAGADLSIGVNVEHGSPNDMLNDIPIATTLAIHGYDGQNGRQWDSIK